MSSETESEMNKYSTIDGQNIVYIGAQARNPGGQVMVGRVYFSVC